MAMNAPAPDLISLTKVMLAQKRGRWPQLCASTGLSYSWVTKFFQGRIKHPGYRLLQRLYDGLQAMDAADDKARAA